MSNYHVGIKNLKFLVNTFELYGFSKKQGVEWIKKNKEDISPEFMKYVRKDPYLFFYYETHKTP